MLDKITSLVVRLHRTVLVFPVIAGLSSIGNFGVYLGIFLGFSHPTSWMLLVLFFFGLISGIFSFLTIVAFSNYKKTSEAKLLDIARLEDLESELNYAKEVQKALFPRKEDIDEPNYDIYGYTIPTVSHKLSGDYFDIFQVKETIYFGIGDVSGHGLSSAIVSMLANKKFRLCIELKNTNLPSIIERIHNDIALEVGTYMSILLGYIDKSDNIHLYGRQESLIHCTREDVECHDINESGFLVGLPNFKKKDIPYFSISLNPGEFLLMYSDGITEAENSDETALGLKGLLSYVKTNKDYLMGLTSHEIVDNILSKVGEWSQGAVQDDRTLLVIRRVF